MCTGSIATIMVVNVIYIMQTSLMIVTMVNQTLVMVI